MEWILDKIHTVYETMGGGCADLAPSDIRYTQSSIKNTFERRDEYEGELIGHTLDHLCDGDCKVKDIPVIKVFQSYGDYWSADNRRLWVFKEFERLGGCITVPIKIVSIEKVDREKFTTKNGGKAVKIRGNPGGFWHSQPDRSLDPGLEQQFDTSPYAMSPCGQSVYPSQKSSTSANQGRQSKAKVQNNASYLPDNEWQRDDYRSRSTPRYNRGHDAHNEDWLTTRNVIKGVIIGYIAFKLIKGLFTS
ncbi:uncharacterized protein LOC135462788 [Liolophura sinensis]|uniref:uncharacterized protein LOC135462788 n=1 Tax=Liolophura sinensis TaxID=3198878 RepID=UPI0031583ED6